MSVSADRSGRFLFGCLIVVLCWIIGAGHLLNGWRPEGPIDSAVNTANAESTALGEIVAPLDHLRWTLQHSPFAFYCFLAAVMLWIISVVARQLTALSRDEVGEGTEEPTGPGYAVWRIFDVGVSLVILVSAGVLLVQGLGWLLAGLICVTTIVCYFLAYGPRHLAEYCRDILRWIDQHYVVGMVNGDLPLGQVQPEFSTRLILPPWWWQMVQHRQMTVRPVPAGILLFGLGMVAALGLIWVFGQHPLESTQAARTVRPPTLLSIPAPAKASSEHRETAVPTFELKAIDDRKIEVGETLVETMRLVNAHVVPGEVRFGLEPLVPPGCRIDPETGVLVWTTTQPGTFHLTVCAISEGANHATARQSFDVYVEPSAQIPELADVADMTVNEGQMVVVLVKVKNRSRLKNGLQFRLTKGCPEGATIDPDAGVITWKPNEAGTYRFVVQAFTDVPSPARVEKSFTVMVQAVASPPELLEINDKHVKEGELVLVTARVRDANRLKGNLQYSLGDDAPAGCEIDPDSGLITWRPNMAGAYDFTVIATTDAEGKVRDQQPFRVVVSAQNRPPVLSHIDDRTIDEGDVLVVPVKVKDPGHPRAGLQYALDGDAPDGASIDPQSGVFIWTPEKSGTYHISVRCASLADASMSDDEAFTVVVREVSEPPRLAEIGNKIVRAGEPLVLPVKISSVGHPAGRLVFGLSLDSPDGAHIDPRTGVIQWTPPADADAGEYPIVVKVRNAARPSLTDEVGFQVTVLPGDRAIRQAREPEQSLELSPAPEPPLPAELPAKPEAGSLEIEPLELTPHTLPRPRPMPPSRFPIIETIPVDPDAEVAQPDLTPESIPLPDPDPIDDEEQTLTNSIGMKLQLVPAGVFIMGSRESAEDIAALDEVEASRFQDELPSHPVRLSKSLYMGRFEVTVGQFTKFVDETGYRTEAELNGKGGFAFNPDSHEFSWGVDFNWQVTGWSQSARHPVVNVSWNDAMAFCKWLSDKEGQTYRLPTEAEWEYACRAGTESRYSSGDSIEELAQAANLGDESFRQVVRPGYSKVVLASGQDGPAFSTPVGEFAPNNFGLYDMHGNVFEWCADWYGSDFYQDSPVDDPMGPELGTKRVIRGGSFYNSPFYSRSSFRNGFPPDAIVPYLGFRVVLELESDPPVNQAELQDGTRNFPFRSVITIDR